MRKPTKLKEIHQLTGRVAALSRFVVRLGEKALPFYALMCDLKASSALPWFAVGDFNEALWQYEHISASPRPEGQMAAFRDALMVCELKDLGF
jgi:hypothetical protein